MAKRREQLDTNVSLTLFEVSGWKFKALAAIGGAILLGAAGLVGTEYQRWRSSDAEQALTALKKAEAYDNLGDVPRLAGEFIATKREGSREDVRQVARLLRSMMFDIENSRYTVAHFQTAIGGRAGYWRLAFATLSSNKSPASSEFSSGELRAFAALADDLGQLLSLYGNSFESAATESTAAAQNERVLIPYH